MDLAIGRARVVVACLVLLGGVAIARAEDVPSAPTATRALANTAFQLVLPQEHLFGDWYGVRTWLENHGVTPAVTFVARGHRSSAARARAVHRAGRRSI